MLDTCSTTVAPELPVSLNPLGLQAREPASATLIQTVLLTIPWYLLLWSLRNQSPVLISRFSWGAHSLILAICTLGPPFPSVSLG